METLYTFKDDKQSEVLDLQPFHLLYIKEADSEDDWHSKLHEHPFAEFFYVSQGEGLMLTPRNSIPLKKGDLTIVNARRLHSEARLEGKNFSYIVLGAEGLSLEKVLSPEKQDSGNLYNLYSESCIVIQSGWQGSHLIGTLFEEILREARLAKPYYSAYCHTLMRLIILQILRLNGQTLQLKEEEKAGAQLEYVRHYLDRHYARNISLDDLASLGYFNKYHLLRCFCEEYGKTPMRYLQERRLTMAETLLATTKYTLDEIAHQVGFSSASYFSQVYRRARGFTPGAYRRQKLRQKSSPAEKA